MSAVAASAKNARKAHRAAPPSGAYGRVASRFGKARAMAGPQTPAGLADGLEVGVPLPSRSREIRPVARVSRRWVPRDALRRLRRTIQCRPEEGRRQMATEMLLSHTVPLA